MDPLHPITPITPRVPPVAPAAPALRVDRDPRREREARERERRARERVRREAAGEGDGFRDGADGGLSAEGHFDAMAGEDGYASPAGEGEPADGFGHVDIRA